MTDARFIVRVTAQVRELVTTSFVDSMPTFLVGQSAQLEYVDGNPCYTGEWTAEFPYKRQHGLPAFFLE